MGALVYLTLCSTRNRIRSRLRRLREPRYALGLLAGLAYFYFLMRPSGHGRSATGVLGALTAVREPVELVASVLVFAIVALAWLWPSDGKASLTFTRADVQFLFTAPLTRRQLITYKLVRMQLGALVSTALITLFFRPGSLAAGWTFFAGMAITSSILIVHLNAVSLGQASIREHGRAGLVRQRLPLLFVVGTLVVLANAVASDWPRLSALERPREIMSALQETAASGMPAVVLWPFRAAVRLPLSATPLEFFRALPAALVLLVVNFIWAVRSDAAFEEASAELAEKVARIRRGAQPVVGKVRKRPAPFRLSTTGPAEIALLWKNLIMLGRYATLKRALVFLPAIVVIGMLTALNARKDGIADTVAFFCFLFTFMTVFMGPMAIRNDLRRDLERIELLKAWPIRGAVLIRGEALAPAAVLTVFAWAFILGTSTSLGHVAREIGFSAITGHLSYTVAALLVAPGLIVTQVFVQNGIAVLFPAWVSIGATRAHGVDVMGQRMLMMGGMFVALVLAVLPAAVFAAIAGAAIYFATSVIPVIVPAAVVTTSLVAECLLASEALGRVMDRTDPAAIEPVE